MGFYEPLKKSTSRIQVELRNVNKKEFGIKSNIESIMKDSFFEGPTGWIENKIDTGKVIFLIDGCDEISTDSRELVFDRLEEIDPECKCKKIYTSRPQITQRPHDRNLLEVTILPMRNNTIKTFLEYWHKAVLEDQLQISNEDSIKIVQKLYSKIKNNTSISKLASSPLLCAMICALHYKSEMNLPINKRELYEECCKLLIENRDNAKGLKTSIKLSYEQKKIVLSQFACWMMMNGHSEVDKKDADYMIQHYLSSMVFAGNEIPDYKQVFPYLLERSGILREPEKNRIDFIHRSFEEYLAATEISRQNNWGYLTTMATDDMWKETVEIAIGYANSETASKLIRSVLNKAKGRRRNKKYVLLACSYYNNAVQVDNMTSNVVKNNLKKLIPPEDWDVEALIKTGDLVVDFLRMDPQRKHTPEEFINPLKILRGIGTVKALEMANSYLQYHLSPEAIKEYGLLIDMYTDKELLDYEVPKLIEQYLYEYYSFDITLHEGMLRALLLAEDKVLDNIETVIGSSVTIIGYTDKLDLSRIFHRNLILRLSLYGHFESINQLYLFPRTKYLVIYTSNHNFTLSYYNRRHIMSLQSLDLGLYSWDSISNLRLYFECKKLTLVSLNVRQSEEKIHLPNCSTLEIDGRYLNKVLLDSQKSTTPNIILLLNKDLFHEIKYISSYNNIEFRNIDELFAIHRECSGKIVKHLSISEDKSQLIKEISNYLKKLPSDVERDFFRIWNEKK